MVASTLFGSTHLARMAADFPITALDVGARGGFVGDLKPVAPFVNGVGFEPDATECAALNQRLRQDSRGWRSVRYLPLALAGSSGRRRLYITTRGGTSSLLPMDSPFGAEFSRADYYQVRETAEVETMSLDEALSKHEIPQPNYLKIDVEGLELEIFDNAPKTLGSLLAIRTEVSFIPPRHGQPLFRDVDRCLAGYGFMMMNFLETHHWRRLTQRKPTWDNACRVPFSEGQLIHGDALYFRDPFSARSQGGVDHADIVRLCLIALCYAHIDFAYSVVNRAGTDKFVKERWGFGLLDELPGASRAIRRQLPSKLRTMLFGNRKQKRF